MIRLYLLVIISPGHKFHLSLCFTFNFQVRFSQSLAWSTGALEAMDLGDLHGLEASLRSPYHYLTRPFMISSEYSSSVLQGMS